MPTIAEVSAELEALKARVRESARWGDVRRGEEERLEAFRAAAMELIEKALPSLVEEIGGFQLGRLPAGMDIVHSRVWTEIPPGVDVLADTIADAASSGRGNLLVSDGPFTTRSLVLASERLPGRVLVVAGDAEAARTALWSVGSVRSEVAGAEDFRNLGAVVFDSVVFLERPPMRDPLYRRIREACRERGAKLFVEQDTGDTERRVLVGPCAHLEMPESDEPSAPAP